MNREELIQYITETYTADPEHPWANEPDYTVFRHRGNKKWFALIMDISGDKLGLDAERISIVNLKNSPAMSGSLRSEKGIFPAYHMNKQQWISAVLGDGGADDELLKILVDMSYNLTDKKRK